MHKQILLLLLLLFFVCFSNPTSPPQIFIGLVKCLVQCVPAYTLSSPTFKGVTSRMYIKNTPTDTFHSLLPRVHAGAAGCLEQTNNDGELLFEMIRFDIVINWYKASG